MMYFLFILLSGLFSQSWYNHTELNWHTFETEHFVFHYHDETERSCREAATVAEKIYKPITEFYQFEPDSKTHIILKDTDDYANGAAYYYDNKIEIWALPLDFDLRGSHRWLQNVITHEFTHIIQIGAAMKYLRKFPASFIQIMGYEDEKRPDVLYGYPNTIISYPIPGTAVPPWLAEGTAQFMYDSANYDYWDSHRDMTLRDRVLNDNLLSLNAMNTFGKRGIGNESTYSMGFRFTQYLANRFGNDILREITHNLSNPLIYSVSHAMEEATGVSGNKLYDEWVVQLKNEYKSFAESIDEHGKSGTLLEAEGTTNIHPKWSPNGEKFAFLSNKNNDYFGQTNLFVYSFKDSTSKKIVGGVQTAPTWVNDSTIVYTHRSKPNKNGSKFFDLYKININDEDAEPKRLTHSERLYSPVYIETNNSIAAITIFDGTSNIVVSSLDSINFSPITDYDDGTYLSSLEWDGEFLYSDVITHQTRDILKIDIENKNVESFRSNNWDDRGIAFSGESFVFTSDKSGVFNLINKEGEYITNVSGGAFMPSISSNGDILYSEYVNGGYKIKLLTDQSIIDKSLVGYDENYWEGLPPSEPIVELNQTPSKKYKDSMSSLSFMPILMLDYKSFKPGMYFMSHDLLDRLSVFGGGSVNSKNDIDLFMIFEFKKYKPTFYTNLFWVTRHKEISSNYNRANGTIAENVHINSDLTFLLFSGEIGTRFIKNGHKFWIDYSYTNYREHVSQKIVQYAPYDTVRYNGDLAFDYFRGHGTSIKYEFSKRKSSFLKDMLPGSGYTIQSKLGYEWNSFMSGFGINEEYSTFGANFAPQNTFRFTLDTFHHYTLNKKHRIVTSIKSKIGYLSNSDVDNFFHFFTGGLPGIRGYSFYNEDLTGAQQLMITNETRFPLFLEKNYKMNHIYFQNLTFGVVSQFGGAFNKDIADFFSEKEYKFSTGVELRLHGYSFYSYPTAIEYEYHQAITDPTESSKHYLSILFGFTN